MPVDDGPPDELLTAALTRLQAELGEAAPYLAGQVSAWLRALARSPQPEDYFRNPIGFPLLRLPWWLEKTLRPEPDAAFQGDLIASTVSGYYFIRLLDNVMDGHPAAGGVAAEAQLLPAAGFFHTQFQTPYPRYFEPGHPFWADFRRLWFDAAEATARDAGLPEISRADFQRYAARKVCAALIPLAAVCYRYERPDRLEPWARFVEAFGAWHQMWNDVFDWSKDLRHGTRTYFLSEAARRKRPDETPAVWVVREGFAWGLADLEARLAEAAALAAALDSPDLRAYLDRRAALLRQQQADVAPGLEALVKLSKAMR